MNGFEMIITREYLQQLFNKCDTYKEILINLQLDPYAGGGYRTIKRYIKQYHIDLTKFEENKAIAAHVRHLQLSKNNIKYTLDNIFTHHTIKVSNDTIKKFMILSGMFEYKCDECNISDIYNNKPITLQVDHIDGNSKNDNIQNLRFLCPNCHSQTETFGSKNKANKKKRTATRTEYWSMKNNELKEKNRELVESVLKSNIDFTKYGWSKQVSFLINKPHQKVATWMRRYMPETYDTAFKRKSQV